jgi:PAS domain S-box-containing protein
MTLVGMLVSLILARSLSRPIEQLTVSAAAVSGGDLSRGLHVRGAMEIEMLGDSINKMIANLSRDTAERELAEEALRESERRYRTLLDTAPASIMVIRKGVLLFCNSFTAKMLGYDSPDVMIGQPVFDVIAAESREALSQRFQNLNEANSTGLLEIRAMDRTGGSRWIEAASLPIRFQGEQAALIIGVDITARRQADMARKRLEREIIEISEREQSRLGRDLHDDVGQQLVGIRLMIEALEMKIENDREAAVVLARQTSNLIRQTILSTRNLARGLYPADLTRLGLQNSLKELAVRTTELSGVRCVTRMNPRFHSAAPAMIHLYRIVQEALTNALRHAHPSHVIIRCGVIQGRSVVQVLNDGVPFLEPPPERRGMGLDIFSYRAEMIGARLTVQRARRGGCVVTCLLTGTAS